MPESITTVKEWNTAYLFYVLGFMSWEITSHILSIDLQDNRLVVILTSVNNLCRTNP